jgi:hypothetical protein
MRCGPSVLLTSQNLALPVRLVACGPSVGLSYSVKNSVNDGLSKVEHQSGLVLYREGGRSRPAAIRRLACGVGGGHDLARVCSAKRRMTGGCAYVAPMA